MLALRGDHSNWYGILTYNSASRDIEDGRRVQSLQPRARRLGGQPINRHGLPFGLTEEFVEIYRLHSLLPEELRLRDAARAT